MTKNPIPTPWFSITRRKMLGSLLIGAGTLLTGCRMNFLGQCASDKGKVLLNRIPGIPPGIKEAVRFPLIEALLGRRARRFALGASIPDGPLAFTSQHNPIPLSELEQMMVLLAVGGNTGWLYLHPYNPRYAPHIPNYASASARAHVPFGCGLPYERVFLYR